MSGAQIFSNAHGTAVSGGTFYAANTVSGTVRYLLSRLIASLADPLEPLQQWQQNDVRWGHSPHAKSEQSVHRAYGSHCQTQEAFFQCRRLSSEAKVLPIAWNGGYRKDSDLLEVC